MSDSPTSSLRQRKMALASNEDQWGDPLDNTNKDIVDQAVVGQVTVTATSAVYTLSTTDYATHEANNPYIVVTGTPGMAVTIVTPGRQRLFEVENQLAYSATVSVSGGTGVVVPPGATLRLRNDGSNIWPVRVLNFGGNTLSNVGAPTLSAHAATRGWTLGRSISDFLAPTTALDMAGFRVSNLGAAVNAGDAVSLSVLDAAISGITISGAVSGTVKVNATDTFDYLAGKLTATGGVSISTISSSGSSAMRISALTSQEIKLATLSPFEDIDEVMATMLALQQGDR